MAEGRFSGRCLCGTIAFELTPPSKFCSHCHCSNCRRAHGAAFVTWAGFREDQVRIVSGEEAIVRYVTDTEATRTFCGKCGSTLFYQGPRWSGELHVALAHVDGEIDRKPQAHCYVDHRASWCTIADDLPQYGGETGMEKKPD